MNQQKIRPSWRQRTASLMIMVFMAGILFSDMPLVYAFEGVPETEEQVSASEIEEQISVSEAEAQVNASETEEPIGVPEDRSYTGEGYEVDATVTTYWEGGYNLCVTVRNTSEETIHNWGILFETQDSIRDLYNAEILSDREGMYLLRNKVYNQDIPVGGSVSFGYTAYHTEAADVPEEYAVSSIEKAVESDSFTVSCLVSDEWESGAVVQLMIENTSERTIEDWILEFDSKMQIEKLWNADLVSYEAGHYVLRNVSYAQNIPAGEMAVVGMHLSAASGIEGEALENVTVRQIVPSGESGSTPSDNQVSDNNVSDNNVSDNNVSDNDISGNEIPEGIINHLSTGGDGGEIYYKTAYESDVVTAPDGLPCIRNQFLLSADDTVDFAEVEAYLAQNGARIVGYIEVTNDYQVEMYQDTDMTDLQELTERIGVQAWVRHIGLNYLWLEEAEFRTTDPWSESGNAAHGELITKDPSGHNWGLDAIDYVGALVNAGVISSKFASTSSITTDHLTTVRMGIFDTAFDEWHEDLDDNFVWTWNNFKQYECGDHSNCPDHGMHIGLRDAFEEQLDREGSQQLAHGTHVAGTMCAEFNNGTGINGICIKNELYGYASHGPERAMPENKIEERVRTTFEAECGFGVLITNHVKVINYSMGIRDGLAYAASVDTGEGRDKATDYLDVQSGYMEEFLGQLLDNGYDFLIVVAAGNGNDKTYYKCTPTDKYIDVYIAGYITAGDAQRELANNKNAEKDLNIEWDVSFDASGNVEAKYNNVFAYISDNSACYDHILCVGAINYDINGHYPISSFSNGGGRVDIYAPGNNIYCTYLTGCAQSNYEWMLEDENSDYGRLNGTSMAAPHVSGVAGLAYNVYPDISAADLKQIIKNTAQNIDGVHVLNAADVIEAVVQYKEADETQEYTIQLHVVDANRNGVRDAAVEVRSWSQYWYRVLGAAMTINAVGGTVVYSGKTDAAGNIKLDIPWGNYYVLVDGENVSIYGFIKNAEIRFIKGWIDVDG
ncbi:MAG: S8 family serine peptidase, partial [Lachnospiraceae bacterium]|nr:S8 family serine peptidase [Lachnospiraceae bacterium]